jgi:nucleoside-diphosphate-sugar epimerase
MRILITGAAGYVGSVLVERLQAVPTIAEIVCVDLKPRPDRLANASNVAWIQADVSGNDWQETAREHGVDALVHLAFQIRQLHGRREAIQRRWNIEGARKVFAFGLTEPSVRRMIHFSTITAYGADERNTLATRFCEEDPLRERDYLYGSHKREIEGLLERGYAASDQHTHVVVLRCASISGPHGRFGLGRFGIVSTLTGPFPFLPCGRADFGRQYLHEDDIGDIVAKLLTAPPRSGYEVYNASPDEYLASGDLATLLGKRTLVVPPVLLRALFALCWRLSRGRVPTPKGVWKFLTYPIAVDGSSLSRAYGHHYRFTSADALLGRAGRLLAAVDSAAKSAPSASAASARRPEVAEL